MSVPLEAITEVAVKIRTTPQLSEEEALKLELEGEPWAQSAKCFDQPWEVRLPPQKTFPLARPLCQQCVVRPACFVAGMRYRTEGLDPAEVLVEGDELWGGYTFNERAEFLGLWVTAQNIPETISALVTSLA